MHKGAPRLPTKTQLDPPGDTRRQESHVKVHAPLKILQVVTIILWTSVHCPEVREIRLPLECLRFATLVMTEIFSRAEFRLINLAARVRVTRLEPDVVILRGA